MIRTPHFTLTDEQLVSLVEALEHAVDDLHGYHKYLLDSAPNEPDADLDELDDVVLMVEEDLAKWTYLHEELQGLVDARPKLTFVKPFNPENN